MTDNTTNTDVTDFIDELGAGVFKEKLAAVLSDAALGVVIHGDKTKKSKVTIELNLQRVGDSDQLMIFHKLAYAIPTKRGKRSEEITTETIMFVGKGGKMTITPPKENIQGQFELTEQNIHQFNQKES